ncbi:Transcription factor [Penicillium argentinense]|uniref:Transcription factor n=1 Tax=Penicillium argentinense TaxID=1131581 RepID=A0A9W9KK55_9EURO|nr:Transcription factor [Penicillium argentinense]KAJ5109649.1 Transcription factor [Penicillium argentinense]
MDSDYPEPPSQCRADSHGRNAPPEDRPAFGMSHAAETSAEPDDLKRPRACEPCRQLKVRCDPDPTHPDGSCKRCAKAGRTCITTAPTRKRQKKTDSRVTELERKIDFLTATLQASHSNAFMGPPGNTHSREEPASSRRWLRDDTNPNENKRTHDGYLASQYGRPNSPSAERISKPADSKHWRGPFGGEVAPPREVGNQFVDVIDRGLVDVQSANAAFERYATRMAPEMPFVMLPAGNGYGRYLHLTLLNEIYQMIADRMVVKGEKCLELVQALMVCSIWYVPPDNFEELKFYQLVHFAVILCMDIGLNRRSSSELKPFAKIRETLIKKPAGDLNGPEARRTWLGCYYMSVQVSTALRRTQLLRWSPYMDECIEVLQTHPDALPTDRKAVWWAKLGFIMEDSSVQLLTEDSESIASFSDSKVRYTIRGFSNQLAQWRREIPDDVYTDTLAHTYHVLNLFIHETAMSVDCKNTTIPSSPSNDKLPTSAIAPLIDALTTSISSIHQAFDIIMNVDPERLTCLPTVTLARTSYPFVSLVKIYSLLTAPDTRIGQVIDMQSLKLEYYLDRVIEHYRKAASLDGGRAAAKFGNILTMLRNWFAKKKENGPALREIFGAETPADSPADARKMNHGATPLQLLSEVASSGASGEPNCPPSTSFSHRPSQSYTPSTLTPGLPPSQSPNPTTRYDSLGTKPEPSWPTPTSFSPSIQNQVTSMSPAGADDPSRTFYQPYGPSQAYPNVPASTTGYPDMSMGMSIAQPMGMPGNEIGMDATFDPDNLFALGTMMDEGLLTFPLSFDSNFQF